MKNNDSIITTLSSFHHGKIIEHKNLKNKDGSPLRCRVNGKIKTWKRNDNFQLPVKYGLKECFYITQDNYNEWVID